MLVCPHVATCVSVRQARYLALGAQVREDTPPTSGAPCLLLLWALQPGSVLWTLLSAHIFFLLHLVRDLSCSYIIGCADRTRSFNFWPMPRSSVLLCVRTAFQAVFSSSGMFTGGTGLLHPCVLAPALALVLQLGSQLWGAVALRPDPQSRRESTLVSFQATRTRPSHVLGTSCIVCTAGTSAMVMSSATE